MEEATVMMVGLGKGENTPRVTCLENQSKHSLRIVGTMIYLMYRRRY